MQSWMPANRLAAVTIIVALEIVSPVSGVFPIDSHNRRPGLWIDCKSAIISF